MTQRIQPGPPRLGLRAFVESQHVFYSNVPLAQYGLGRLDHGMQLTDDRMKLGSVVPGGRIERRMRCPTPCP